MNKDLLKLDLYDLLDIDPDSSEKQIKKAYKKKALHCHPDKNKNDPNAADKFIQLQQALDTLTNPAEKAAYDRVFKARKRQAEKEKTLSEDRKRLKADLEAREAHAREQFEKGKKETAVEREAARLRREYQQEQEREIEAERLRRKLAQEAARYSSAEPDTPKLKVTWKAEKLDASNAGYDRVFLRNLFSQFGKVLNLIISPTRKGTALVEYAETNSAIRAVTQANRGHVGFPENPLRIRWIGDAPSISTGQPEASAKLSGNGTSPEPARESFAAREADILAKMLAKG